MEWLGYNNRVDISQLKEGVSPDCANCCCYKGRIGALGPRPGLKFFNSSEYGDNVYGATRLVLSDGSNRWLTATGDGGVADNAADLSSEPSPDTSSSGKVFYSVATLTSSGSTNSTQTVEVTSNFQDSASYTKAEDEIPIFNWPSIAVTITGASGGGYDNVLIYPGLVTSGGNVYAGHIKSEDSPAFAFEPLGGQGLSFAGWDISEWTLHWIGAQDYSDHQHWYNGMGRFHG